MRILIAIDSFKGSLTSDQAAEAVKEGIKKFAAKALENTGKSPSLAVKNKDIIEASDMKSQYNIADINIDVILSADGGEGTMDAVRSALAGSAVSAGSKTDEQSKASDLCELTSGSQIKTINLCITGPCFEKIDSDYLLFSNDEMITAVIETARCCGLPLIPEGRRDPSLSTTIGIGEQIVDAFNNGARRFIIGLGGSGTNDGGIGMLSALGFTFRDRSGNEIKPCGRFLSDIYSIEYNENIGINECEFIAACDVRNPLTGPDGSSAVFGPQKGADPDMVKALDEGMKNYAAAAERFLCLTSDDEPLLYKREKNDHTYPGSGAAGGLGFAIHAFLDGQLISGSELVIRLSGMEEKVKAADLVITGEGAVDDQTGMGKFPEKCAELARRYNKPVWAFTGIDRLKGQDHKLKKDMGLNSTDTAAAGNGSIFDRIIEVDRHGMDLKSAMETSNAFNNLKDTVFAAFEDII
ncbi:MAG: glycerate kinase [Lachnospiraceae bacterium]|jgi:glycerate kinase|nr:glycerate kinase [Lachnospiraceae bacterium]MEE3461204.1 glycerate kinase [Lachnospiraceae bacterium]